jgi:hypothetical protein
VASVLRVLLLRLVRCFSEVVDSGLLFFVDSDSSVVFFFCSLLLFFFRRKVFRNCSFFRGVNGRVLSFFLYTGGKTNGCTLVLRRSLELICVDLWC